jgi:transposase
MQKELLEECLAEGMSLEAIGKRVGKHESTVSYWLKKHGLEAMGAQKFSRRGAIGREEIEVLVDGGASLSEIAEELDRSVSTIRYWLGRYGLKTANRRGRISRRSGGAATETFECSRHGTTEFVLEGRGYYRCKQCRSAAVARRRRKVKQQLVVEAGGACVLCGYSRWQGALQFHHVEPASKEFQLAHHGHSRSIAKSRAEAQKCVLLCANCHAEVEGGFATLPGDRRQRSGDAVR